jgi:hypothetical protein
MATADQTRTLLPAALDARTPGVAAVEADWDPARRQGKRRPAIR